MKKTKLLLALCLAGSMAHAQIIYTAAGTGTSGYTGDGGFGVSGKLALPQAVAVDASGNIYIGDTNNNRVRKVSKTGIITTFAGNGTSGHTGDGGQATAAEIGGPFGLVFDASGNLFMADGNYIRKINTSGVISTYAGTGSTGYSGDGGAATAATFNGPGQMTIDGSGNMFIPDINNGVIRKINTSGIISTVAGTGGTNGYTGDGGAATSATLHGPVAVAVDASGNLYISDNFNNVIRKVNTSGIISTYAGTGVVGYTGDGGAAASAEFNFPWGMSVNSSDLYICDQNNGVIRKVNSSGTISTAVGNGTQGYTGNGGSPLSAELAIPRSMCFSSSGNIFIADAGVSVIREISSACPAIAGPNKIVINPGACCSGSPAVIGSPAVPNMTYAWSPSTSLSSTSAAQPTSTWTNTSTCQIYTVTVSYSLCTTSTSTVQVCAQGYMGNSCCRIAAGIATENQADMAFNVYPNPANGQVTITLYDKASYIHVVDMQGRVVFEAKETAAGDFKLDISKFNKGVYFVSAKIGDTLEKQKLIVE